LLDRNWNQTILEGVRVYALSDYHSALLIMPIAFIIGLAGAACVKETFCEAVEEDDHIQ
jgi:hypothetical protein